MIIGIGLDEMDVARMEKELHENPGVRETLFTSGEIAYCESKRYSAQNYAARFAAKEAFLKALGTGRQPGQMFNEIEIVHDESGRPACALHGRIRKAAEERSVDMIHVSLTHLKDVAAAVVVLEKL